MEEAIETDDQFDALADALRKAGQELITTSLYTAYLWGGGQLLAPPAGSGKLTVRDHRWKRRDNGEGRSGDVRLETSGRPISHSRHSGG